MILINAPRIEINLLLIYNLLINEKQQTVTQACLVTLKDYFNNK